MGVRASLGVDACAVSAFSVFFVDTEPRLRAALTSGFDADVGREAAHVALAYGWEHWERVAELANPVGYLFIVGRNFARREVTRWTPALEAGTHDGEMAAEPALGRALGGLTQRQRLVLGLVHGYGWTLSEVAELLELSKSSVQNHLERGLRKLRSELGVEVRLVGIKVGVGLRKVSGEDVRPFLAAVRADRERTVCHVAVGARSTLKLGRCFRNEARQDGQ